MTHPAVVKHPFTGESIIYISEGFTCGLIDAEGKHLEDELLHRILEATGQYDTVFEHENIHLQSFDVGDLLIWDNRSLVHRARHTPAPEPTVSFRITVNDEFPLSAGESETQIRHRPCTVPATSLEGCAS